MHAPMPHRLPLLLVLLFLSCFLLGAAGARGAAATPASAFALAEDFEGIEDELEVEGEGEEGEGESVAVECETAREEVGGGEIELEEADEICAEATAEARPAAHPKRGKPNKPKAGKHRAQRRKKKACRGKPAAGKRRCARKPSRN